MAKKYWRLKNKGQQRQKQTEETIFLPEKMIKAGNRKGNLRQEDKFMPGKNIKAKTICDEKINLCQGGNAYFCKR